MMLFKVAVLNVCAFDSSEFYLKSQSKHEEKTVCQLISHSLRLISINYNSRMLLNEASPLVVLYVGNSGDILS